MRLIATILAAMLPTAAMAQAVVFSFASAQGEHPDGIVADSAGNIYGTLPNAGFGQIYKITPAGVFSTVFAPTTEGHSLAYGPLAIVKDTLFGAGPTGGIGYGTIYKIRTDGTGYTTLHRFNGADGEAPEAAPRLGPDGNLYGTTSMGGTGGGDYYPTGVVYRETPDGTFTVLHMFNVPGDGFYPSGQIAISQSGVVYGTTSEGGTAGAGTVWSIDTTTGVYTLLHSFQGERDGAYPLIGGVMPNGIAFGSSAQEVGNAGVLWRILPNGTFQPLAQVYGIPNAPIATQSGSIIATTGGTNQASPNGESIAEVSILSADDVLTQYNINPGNNSGPSYPNSNFVYVNGVLESTSVYGGDHDLGTIFSFTEVTP